MSADSSIHARRGAFAGNQARRAWERLSLRLSPYEWLLLSLIAAVCGYLCWREIQYLTSPYYEAKRTVERAGGTWHETRHEGGDTTIQLDLRKRAIGDDDLRRLTAWAMVDSLDLSETRVTDRGASYLPHFTKLRVLNLRGTAVTDAAVDSLLRLPGLRSVSLAGTTIDDDAIPKLAELAELEELDLSRTLVDDAGLKHLAACPRLVVLRLVECPVTAQGVARLQQAKPRLCVQR